MRALRLCAAGFCWVMWHALEWFDEHEWATALLGCVIALGLIAGMGWLLILAEERKCRITGEVMGLSSKYETATECLLLVEGRWVPLANYRVTSEGKP